MTLWEVRCDRPRRVNETHKEGDKLRGKLGGSSVCTLRGQMLVPLTHHTTLSLSLTESEYLLKNRACGLSERQHSYPRDWSVVFLTALEGFSFLCLNSKKPLKSGTMSLDFIYFCSTDSLVHSPTRKALCSKSFVLIQHEIWQPSKGQQK